MMAVTSLFFYLLLLQPLIAMADPEAAYSYSFLDTYTRNGGTKERSFELAQDRSATDPFGTTWLKSWRGMRFRHGFEC